ncbi:MAG: hypothetical protein AAB393_07045, partial [Bacteroidota bacterium]
MSLARVTLMSGHVFSQRRVKLQQPPPRNGGKRSLNLFVLLLLSMLCSPIKEAVAQPASVAVRLQQPPPNQLRAADLWKVTLTNSSRMTYRIWLEGTLEEAGSGLVADGRSGLMDLPPGTKTITYDEVKKGGSVNLKSGKWQEAFTRTGNAPSGDYTICISVKAEAKAGASEEIGRDCIRHSVQILAPIEQPGAQRALVTVRLQQPPPNQLRAADLWKATLTNTSKITY